MDERVFESCPTLIAPVIPSNITSQFKYLSSNVLECGCKHNSNFGDHIHAVQYHLRERLRQAHFGTTDNCVHCQPQRRVWVRTPIPRWTNQPRRHESLQNAVPYDQGHNGFQTTYVDVSKPSSDELMRFSLLPQPLHTLRCHAG